MHTVSLLLYNFNSLVTHHSEYLTCQKSVCVTHHVGYLMKGSKTSRKTGKNAIKNPIKLYDLDTELCTIWWSPNVNQCLVLHISCMFTNYPHPNSSSKLSIDSANITDDKSPWSVQGSSSCLLHPADKTWTLSQVILPTDKCKFLPGMSQSQ